MLRFSNGLMNTLAPEGANKYNFIVQNDGEVVKLKTKVVTATIKGTLIDEDPLAVFKIDQILLPKELFKETPLAPAPTSPTPAKSKAKSGSEEDADAPALSQNNDSMPTDETTDSNAAAGIHGGWFIKGILSCFLEFLYAIFDWGKNILAQNPTRASLQTFHMREKCSLLVP
ncbi:fasciclin-like arabinogalactan protein 2 [Olea europaea var. sylvestris]|uniref:fasciclin-like arabinogalactan protein 2 n=1 Tax=Olea europaea var. sylvestris TaxID=158386 RepID=UPI000C1D711B|nr:fasciclin-like arabinogalactan protein 2 [Olea europaea var. sylvestris]